MRTFLINVNLLYYLSPLHYPPATQFSRISIFETKKKKTVRITDARNRRELGSRSTESNLKERIVDLISAKKKVRGEK